MKTAAIILAAGSGKRMGAGQNKLFLTLRGKAVLQYTVEALQRSGQIDGLVLVTKSGEMEQVRQLIPQTAFDKILTYTTGGRERQDSVLCGLEALPDGYDRVLIHDGARPLVTEQLLTALLAAVRPDCGAVAAVPAKDTIKRADADGMVQETLVRSQLWNVQTPQCFYTAPILRCYRQAQRDGYQGTDDASIAERYGLAVKLVLSYYENIKLTTPEDLDVAEVFLRRLGL